MTELQRDAEEHERWNRRNPEQEPRKAYLSDMFDQQEGVFVAATDYMSSLARGIEQWVPGRYEVLGTDVYGLSESRDVLRDHFEVSDKYIAQAALYALYKEGRISQDSFNEHVQAILGGSGTNA